MGRGALTFKGDVPHKKKSSLTKSKKRPLLDSETTDSTTTTWNPTRITSIIAQQQQQQRNPTTAQPLSQPQIVIGRGTITVSGTVVTGYDTKFNTDVQVGDAILIHHEMRIITMRLSDISLNVSSPFSSNIITSKPIPYSYICKPRDMAKDSEFEQQKAELQKAADIERHQNAFSSVSTPATTTLAGSNPNNGITSIVYRERTEHGNYRIKHMKNPDGNTTDRSEMLDIRSKKASDKYC